MLQRNPTGELRQIKRLQVERLYRNGMSVAQCCKAVGISVHTYYKWCSREETDAPEPGVKEDYFAKGER